MSNLMIFCDFDGTITKFDAAEYILENFSSPEWKIYDRLYAESKITLEESIKKQYSLIQIPEHDIINILDKKIEMRPGFIEFYNYCKQNNIELKILSAGLDFYIKHFLKDFELEILAPTTRFNKNSGKYDIDFTELKQIIGENISGFKKQVVIKFKQKPYTIKYLGDGLSDREVIEFVDKMYVVKNSPLHRFMLKNNYNYHIFENFTELIPNIK